MQTLKEALNKYLQRGFGSMTKNDFEVWIFYFLLQERLKGKSNYEISRELQIPETKVKRLRYEVDLKYSSDDNIEVRLYDIINKALTNAYIKEVGKDFQIQFVIEDLGVRKYIEYRLKKDGYFLDSSFNSEIVSIRSEALMKLYQLTPNGKTEFAIFEKNEKIQKGNNSKEWFKEFLKGLFLGVGEGVGLISTNLALPHLISM